MTAPFFLFGLVGLGLFYLQSLVLFPHVRLHLLALLIFAVGLRQPLSLALALGLVLGGLQDSYATTPFGLHLGGALVLVACARFFRRRLLLQRLSSQVLASLGALALKEVWLQVIVSLLGFRGFSFSELVSYRSLELLGTAALAPLMFALTRGLERLLRRLGGGAIREPAPL